MPKTYIFIHDLKTNHIKVISNIPRRHPLYGKYLDYHFYDMYFSIHKNFICDCPRNNYQDGLCNHRKTFLKLFLDIKSLPIAETEIQELITVCEIATNY